MTTTNQRLEAAIAGTLDNAHTILSAFDHIGSEGAVGFDLAACCAMVELESGGRMVWGADPWNQGAYPKGAALPVSLHEQPVTEADYHAYRARRNEGLQPQGCGITQLTSPTLQVAAERAGGCWVPFYNCRVGFGFLKALFREHAGAAGGFAAYNGSGPAAAAYGQRAVGLQAAWQARVNAAVG